VIVSDWMVARAAAAVGEGELSLRFAKRAHSAAQEYEVRIGSWRQARKASLGRSRHWVTSKNSTLVALAARLVEVIAIPRTKLIASQLADIEAP